MSTKALCLTTLALLCTGTAQAQMAQVNYTTACGNECGCDTGGDVCWDGSTYACQDWCDDGGKMRGRPFGLQRCPGCPGGIGCKKCSCMTNGCLSKCCGTKAWPDAGWAPPTHYPVNRDGVWYQNWLPQAAYGTPGGGFIASYPQVYQANDTTQLGYSYAKVPTWQTNMNRIPPVPRPSAFHNRSCPGAFGPHGYGYSGGYYGGCPNGYCQVTTMSFPSVQPVPVQPAAVQPVAVQPVPVPPVPAHPAPGAATAEIPASAPAAAQAAAEAVTKTTAGSNRVRTVSGTKKSGFSLKKLKYLFD
jgi:hypothetical protein